MEDTTGLGIVLPTLFEWLCWPVVKCCALPGSGLRLKANRVRGFGESGDKVRGERNPKLKSTYFWGSSPPIYTSSKPPSCNNDYESKPSKNPPEYSLLSTEGSDVFHNFPPNSINILLELSSVFHPLPYYILPSVPLRHTCCEKYLLRVGRVVWLVQQLSQQGCLAKKLFKGWFSICCYH